MSASPTGTGVIQRFPTRLVDELFWQFIDDARHKGEEDDAVVREALIQNLRLCDHNALDAFHAFLLRQSEALDTPALRQQAAQFWNLDDKSWLHLRAWFVSRGFVIFREARNGSKHLFAAIGSEYPGVLRPPNGEIFLRCVADARERIDNGGDMRN